MSIIERLESAEILPNEFLWEMLKLKVYKDSSSHTILTLIENKLLEENKEPIFEEFKPWGIRSNEHQKQKIINHLGDIKNRISQYYWPDFIEFYVNEIIRNLFPEQADSIIEARNIIQKDLAQTNS